MNVEKRGDAANRKLGQDRKKNKVRQRRASGARLKKKTKGGETKTVGAKFRESKENLSKKKGGVRLFLAKKKKGGASRKSRE